MIKKKFQKNGYIKSRNLSEEKKPTPSTNIPLLSYLKSEQLCNFWPVNFKDLLAVQKNLFKFP